MERDDRSPVGTFFVDAALATGATASLGEQAAHHARVKRLLAGDAVRLTDGAGSLATGTIGDIRRTSLVIAVETYAHPPTPAIHLRVPVADRDRMLWLAEKATELGLRAGSRFGFDARRVCLLAARQRFMRSFVHAW